MSKIYYYLLECIILCTLFGCQQAELAEPEDMVAVKMKTVTMSAGIDGVDTKASLDSQTGAFTWQSGDLISVLATDGKFYDFILEGEYGVKTAEFVGKIPETAAVTTVATYPRIVANGTENTVLTGNTLNYGLPATWNYVKDVSNVPMVATFGEGAEHMSFKQVGGVMRFPVKNLPKDAKFVVTMHDKTITGEFPVDIATLGESSMTAGTAASELVINYTSDADGQDAEFNVPVPTGVYNNFKVTIKDASDNVLFTKDYIKENTVKRATLLNMKELVLPERPLVISEVWPFFVDARVVFPGVKGVDQYAFYIDGSEEAVIVAAEDLKGKVGALVGGKFAHNSTHKVAVAKVVDGKPVVTSKSAEVEFTTADVYQMTQNTGTKFVTVGWDDVAIPNGTRYENGKWNTLPKLGEKDGLKQHQRRGYEVRLLDADGNVVYEMIPFCGHEAFTGAYSDSSWLGKVGGANIMIPTALAFGYLEPGKDYYFQVRTLPEAVVFDETNGNYIPDGDTSQPYPYKLLSERGGCAWSDLVKVSTDPAHVPSENEVLYEGFDDIMIHSDYINWSPAVVPDLVQTRISFADYCATLVTTYPEFLKNASNHTAWTAQAFSKQIYISELGILNAPHVNDVDNVFNANAGSLEGWSYNSTKSNRTIQPIFGAVRLGQSGSSNNGVTLKTPSIYSDNLLPDIGTKCIVTINVAYCSTDLSSPSTQTPLNVFVSQYRDNAFTGKEYILNVKDTYPEEYAANVSAYNKSETEYAHHQRYYELKCEFYLKNGDQLAFTKPTNGNNKGMLVIGEIKVEAVPGAYEDNAFVDNGVGTAPDDTNYDAFGLGEFPISFWWSVPTSAHNYDSEKTLQLYSDMAASGINIVNYVGELDYSFAENKRIMSVAEQVGMKFIGNVNTDENGKPFETHADRVATIKEHFATSDTYVGEYVVDEPLATTFDQWAEFVNEYVKEIPNKEPYINLYPSYASTLGASSYDEYIISYLDKLQTKSLSYDYYGLGKNYGLSSQYYLNLDLVRARTLERKKPFWVITQAGEIGSCKQPTELEQRWSVWSTIAGGSKGISYFCYWTPSEEEFSEVHYMVKDGVKTENYYYISRINADIKTIGKKLLPCHADGMINTLYKNHPLFTNDGAGRTNYGPVKSIMAKEAHLTCGCFRDARISMSGENYKGYKVLLTHEYPTLNLPGNYTAAVALDPAVTEITVTHCNITKAVQLSNTLNEQVSENVSVTYDGAYFVVSMPEGEAVLLEF